MQTRLSRLFMTRIQISLGNQVLRLSSHPRKSPVSLRGGGGVMKIRFDSFYFPFFSTFNMAHNDFSIIYEDISWTYDSGSQFAFICKDFRQQDWISKKRILLQDNGTK